MGTEEETVSKEKYNECKTWQEKANLVSLYHTLKSLNNKDWFIKDTASHFGISIGLVSESIRLAMAIDDNEFIMRGIKTREEALKLIERRKYARDRKDPIHEK